MTLRGPPADRTPAQRLSFGVVNLDKPPGPSSHQVSGWIRDAVADALETAGAEVSIDRAAHAGTLDPKVTGCLPVMLGDATRLAPVFLEGRKEYVAVLECHGPVPSDVESVVAEFEGPIYQKPPRKSAVSRRLRVREIYELDVLETTDRQVLLRMRCESGTYVRKLCHDLGLALGTGAHMGHLRRTATDPFDDRTLRTAHDLLDALAFWADEDDPDLLCEVVDPAERTLEHIPSVTIAESAAREVAHGAQVYAPGVIAADDVDRGTLVACYTPDGAAVCLGRLVGDPDAEEGVVVELERVLV
ncbi:RNA-guided pseudouridylation complex pseudouridine synthase subunit Cbf5 [Halomontanus rarus]|uniref:RNA-guided pseudouridylation complex pseudouridine synthase subunit Cbf5 n=1 Tax=Halomontanus rarus TaxID=3034020 RepID=UPI001A98F0B6